MRFDALELAVEFVVGDVIGSSGGAAWTCGEVGEGIVLACEAVVEVEIVEVGIVEVEIVQFG